MKKFLCLGLFLPILISCNFNNLEDNVINKIQVDGDICFYIINADTAFKVQSFYDKCGAFNIGDKVVISKR